MTTLRPVLPRLRLAAVGVGLAAPALAQIEVAPPTRFQRILWCSDAAGGPRVARTLDFTAVQLGRGGDPAVPVAQGLGYYLDQPIGKGFLELRDEDWQPILRAYERTRDPATLVRPQCLATPGLVARLAGEAADEARRVAGAGLVFVSLADEASATRHDAPLDTCRCGHCLAAFRDFVRRRHATIDGLNQSLGTHFATFDDVEPMTTDQVRRRELGDIDLPQNLRPFGLRQEFVDEQFAAAVRTIAASVQQAVPRVPVGLTGLQVPAAFGGNDYARLLPFLSLAEPYPIGASGELARCLSAPGAHRYATLFPPGADSPESTVPLAALVRARLSAMVAQGLAGVVVWSDGTVADPAGKPTPFGAAVREEMQRIAPVADACAGARTETDSVWLVESQASVRTWWMLDSAVDGLTWVRRLSSYEKEHSTSQAARLGWVRLFEDLGVQPLFVAEAQLPERLLRERPRCLVLPATIALSDRSAQAIESFVRNGGALVADHSAALYDEALARRPVGALDALFAITARSLAWTDLLVRQGRCTSRAAGLPLAEKGLAGQIGERQADGDAFLEHVVGRGRTVYLNAPVCEYGHWRLDEQKIEPARELRRRLRTVLRQVGVPAQFEVRGEGLPTCLQRTTLRLRDGRTVLTLRVNALDSPPLLQRLARAGPRAVQVELPSARTLRHLGGSDLGTGTRFDLQLDPYGAVFLEVVR